MITSQKSDLQKTQQRTLKQADTRYDMEAVYNGQSEYIVVLDKV